MTKEEYEAFIKAWRDYPSQDNEGYQPDRGGFKCGWFAALEWVREEKSPFSLNGSNPDGVVVNVAPDGSILNIRTVCVTAPLDLNICDKGKK